MKCNVCDSPLTKLIYDPQNNISLTSLCQIQGGSIRVFACTNCGHIQTNEMENLKDYYSESYTILLNSEEEDQIYKILDGQPLYRTTHQVNTLAAKVGNNFLQNNQRILDYGCAKSSTMKQLISHGVDAQIYLFDVSDMYVSYWQSFLPDDHWATYQIPDNWLKSFDLITSFFALEHIADLQLSLEQIKQCLKPGGTFYFIVPNTFTNPSDFIVADHVNHFTHASLSYMLTKSGFTDLNIDDQAHFGAFVVMAKLENNPITGITTKASAITMALQQAEKMASYWGGLNDKIRAFESLHSHQSAVIYGSGVYGSFILSSLQNRQNIRCFIDRSPYQQGQTILDKPVIAPQAVAKDVEVMYVGLNPQISQQAISEVEAFASLNCEYLFL
jgi:2-polyprenyl-3-methyl-5-hydroxy-6-metoxy-1,4-benzoquinol methylase